MHKLIARFLVHEWDFCDILTAKSTKEKKEKKAIIDGIWIGTLDCCVVEATAVSVNGPYKVKRINIFDLLTGVMV